MKNKLYTDCRHFRKILDNCKVEIPELFGTFPNAYCADASLWLCDYLINKGYDRTLFRFRSRDPFLKGLGNHIWLNYSGYNLDVTADQFINNGFIFHQVIVSDKDPNYVLFDVEWCKKDYSAHNYSPICCMYDQWDERYEIIYKKLGLIFNPESVSIAI